MASGEGKAADLKDFRPSSCAFFGVSFTVLCDVLFLAAD